MSFEDHDRLGIYEEKQTPCLILVDYSQFMAALSYPAIESRLRELHSYELPELVAFTTGQGARPYLDWLLTSEDASFT